MSNVIGTTTNHGQFRVDGNPKKTSSYAQEQEVNDLTEFLKLERNKYVQYKIVYDILEEFVNEEDRQEDGLRAKVKEILLCESVTQVTLLDENTVDGSKSSVFGLCNVSSPALTYSESKSLQDVIKKKLNEKYLSITDDFHSVANKDMTEYSEDEEITTSIKLCHEDKVLVEYKNKLLMEQEQYIRNLITLSELLGDITDLRISKLPGVIEDKVKECQVNEKINSLKSLLAQEKCRVDIFTETTCSLKAYKELIKDIKEQQHECQKDIENLDGLKNKYKEVSCKQFDDILESYLQYKSSIEKKKILYDCLKS
ncbi:unnamed protein product [Phaedon cochleariae]|uniref:Uncharacterized protein n=1 Tax=Phaedon cochleariae TaxID=80249 RepID=A0A9P0GQT7_PHACE|nr:unnamed protein product [Phaedon cochleariae]